MRVRNMEPGIEQHGDDETLESYALGTLSGKKLVWLEEHLLLCGSCQQRVQKTDEYVSTMRMATAALVKAETKSDPWTLWRPALAMAAVLLLAVVFVVRRSPVVRTDAVTVNLQALRGPAISAAAPAGKSLLLSPDVTGVGDGDAYRLEVVTATGAAVWSGQAQGRPVRARVPALRPGAYFVRMYSPAGEALREFGLDVR